MPYRIKKPIPTRAVGKCPMCECENQILHVVAGKLEGETVVEYVCARCLVALDDLMVDKRPAMRVNPEVEVNGDA